MKSLSKKKTVCVLFVLVFCCSLLLLVIYYNTAVTVLHFGSETLSVPNKQIWTEPSPDSSGSINMVHLSVPVKLVDPMLLAEGETISLQVARKGFYASNLRVLQRRIPDWPVNEEVTDAQRLHRDFSNELVVIDTSTPPARDRILIPEENLFDLERLLLCISKTCEFRRNYGEIFVVATIREETVIQWKKLDAGIKKYLNSLK
ncbi:MAG: hypothetical protein JNL25_04920 [Rhodospirillaceae bacterium]|nr:hypothetical protein [Rhodospirillaceae bacterium]